MNLLWNFVNGISYFRLYDNDDDKNIVIPFVTSNRDIQLSLTHRSRPPKEVIKLPPAAEG